MEKFIITFRFILAIIIFLFLIPTVIATILAITFNNTFWDIFSLVLFIEIVVYGIKWVHKWAIEIIDEVG
jgi:hypothetical protein